ncbi:MAG: type II toxin-antitoxin system VapC family toxin [Casimicrobiaceae bacterium]
MIGLDTNVIVRYLTQDDPKQSALANRLIEETLSPEAPGFISVIALIELVWVLESGYQSDRAQVASVLQTLLRAKTLVLEHADVVWQAVRIFSSGKAEFADCIIERMGNANGCDHTLTFDRIAAKSAGMRLLER